jgi:hypothetical protein
MLLFSHFYMDPAIPFQLKRLPKKSFGCFATLRRSREELALDLVRAQAAVIWYTAIQFYRILQLYISLLSVLDTLFLKLLVVPLSIASFSHDDSGSLSYSLAKSPKQEQYSRFKAGGEDACIPEMCPYIVSN